MVKRLDEATAERMPKGEVVKILADTAQAVKVMKASWLRVALNLKKIRKHELWRHATPACASYEDYAYGVLKLNRAVERRMVSAMEYTEERRPTFIEDFEERGDEVDVPSYEVVNQLRRVEDDFKDKPEEWKNLESMVFDEGAGRITLKKEIDERLGVPSGAAHRVDAPEHDSLEAVAQDLMTLESRLRKLKASKPLLKLCFELVEALQHEARGPKKKDADDTEAKKASEPKGDTSGESPPW